MTMNRGEKPILQPAKSMSLVSVAIAVLSVLFCLAVRMTLNPFLDDRAPFAFFFIAVLISSWIGGWVPGLLSLVLSALAADYYFVDPKHVLGFSRSADASNLMLFLGIGLCLCTIGHVQRKRTLELAESEERYRRLSQEVGARAEREALLNRIGALLRTLADPENIQSTAVAELGKALHADRCYFALYDLRAETVTVVQDWRQDGIDSIAGVHEFANTSSMFDELYRDSNTSVVHDCYECGLSAETIANMERLGLRARVSAALADSNALMAILTVAMSETPRNWSPEEVAVVETVATQLRSAIDSARVQIREHRIATELQAALQPSIPSTLPGLELSSFIKPALDEAAVGGDFYDVFRLDKQISALIIGDVSGKGLTAAAQVATVRNMLRAFLYDYRAPANAVSKLNAVVTMNDLLTGFVTAFVGIYDAASGVLRYVSCGHEPGLIRRASDDSIEQLRTTGPPLGAAESAVFVAAEARLSPGDTLLLYTDGLSESGPSRQQLLGTEGMIEFLKQLPPDLETAQAAQWLVTQAGIPSDGVFRDDVCVLLARNFPRP
jgi:hypothetical protein